MDEIWQARSKSYQKMIMKYLKYVLNDHLVLALLFLAGGLGLSYSNWLKTLSPDLWYLAPLILVVGWLLSLIGKPVLLLEVPDQVFLLAQEKNIARYLKKSLIRSLISVLLPLIVGTVVMLPLLALHYHQLLLVESWALTVVLASFSGILNRYQQLYFDTKLQQRWWHWGILVVIWSCGLITPLFSLGLAMLDAVVNGLYLNQIMRTNRFNWKKAVDIETARMNQLYHFFNLFTDVKNIKVGVKRRKYADGMISFLSGKQQLFSYLYPRVIIRSGNRGSLMLRLLILGMLIEIYSSQTLFKAIVGAIITYLIVIQLVDVYRPIHENVFIKIYPVELKEAEKDLLSVMKRIILISAIFLIVTGLISNLTWHFLVLAVVAQTVSAILLLKWFIPRYIKKLN